MKALLDNQNNPEIIHTNTSTSSGLGMGNNSTTKQKLSYILPCLWFANWSSWWVNHRELPQTFKAAHGSLWTELKVGVYWDSKSLLSLPHKSWKNSQEVKSPSLTLSFLCSPSKKSETAEGLGAPPHCSGLFQAFWKPCLKGPWSHSMGFVGPQTGSICKWTSQISSQTTNPHISSLLRTLSWTDHAIIGGI